MPDIIISPLKPFYFQDSKILILGSFPSVKSREKNFYYSHPTNRFFKILYFLFNEEYQEDIEKRKEFLKEHKIALYDVIHSCTIHSSDDSSISDVTPTNIEDILSSSKIKMIFLTGNKAYKLFKHYHPNLTGIPLPSPSSANAKMSFTNLIDSYKIILKYLEE